MANYTLVPSDNVVVINGVAAFGVDFSGLNPLIHAVQWYGDLNSGYIEYVVTNPVTGQKTPNEEISTFAPYMSYISQAEEIIQARENPTFYYSTVDNNSYQGGLYNLGQTIIVDTPNTAQPPQTTTEVPPTPESFQDLYWFSSQWVISSFDPNLSLLQAQQYLIAEVNSSAASNVNNQARIYSVVQLDQTADILVLPTADYSGIDLGTYQGLMDSEVTSMTNQINAASSQTQLYTFNPNIDPNP